MKKIILLILGLIALSIVAFGQTDYYIIDNTYNSGVRITDYGAKINAELCEVVRGLDSTSYKPDVVDEYGFKNGKVYCAKLIQISGQTKHVFLERIAQGKMTVYYYRGDDQSVFYYENEKSEMIEIPKKSTTGENFYTTFLLNKTSDCPNMTNNVKLVKYTKRSMANFLKQYNNCDTKPTAHQKFGLILGYELVKSDPELDIEYIYNHNMSMKYDGSLSIGFFADIPISASDFSFYGELLYSKHDFSYNILSGNETIDFTSEITSLKLPFLLKYASPSNKIRPFGTLGGILTNNFRNNNTIHKVDLIDQSNTVHIKTPINKTLLGYSIGAGLEFKLTYKRSLFLNFRYNKSLGLSDSNIKYTSLNFSTGINF